MVTRDVRVLNMSLSLPSATCRKYTWSTNRVDLDQGGYKHHAALSSVAMVAMCEYCHAVRLYYVKKNSLGSNPSSHREDLFFLWTKSPLSSCPIATERIRSQLMFIVKYWYTDVFARTHASQIGKLLRCSEWIEIQSRILRRYSN